MRIPQSMWTFSFLAVLAALVMGCEDDSFPNTPPEPPPHARGGGSQAQPLTPIGNDGMVAVPSEKWDRIKSYFESYSGASTTNRRDPYRNYLASYAQKPDLPRVVEEEEVEETEPKEVLSPLEKFPVEDFELLMVMSGTSRPKAVVLDPMGTPWVVRPDTPLGNKGGLVQAITQYSIVVSEPGSDLPAEITIRPVILDAAAELVDTQKPKFVSKPLTTAPIR